MVKISCSNCDGIGYHNDGEADDDLCSVCVGDGTVEITDEQYHRRMQELRAEAQQLDLGG